MLLRRFHVLRVARHHGFALLTLFLITVLQAQASGTGVPVSLAITPAPVVQGDDAQTLLKTTVTLATPSPTYFICEVRSEEKRKLECTNIIFKKGDTTGTGTATVHWSNVPLDSTIKITAFNVDTPDTAVSFTVNLQVKGERNP